MPKKPPAAKSRPDLRTAAKKTPAPHPMTHGKALVYGDCMDVMDRWISEGYAGKVDLIYLDPPFNSNAKYNVLYGTDSNGNGKAAQIIAFDDTWTWDAAAAERMADLRAGESYPREMKRTADALEALLGNSGMLAYLSYMAQRLARCRNILAETGSVYLHCDPTASHYLKILMDAIFGAKNFRNEIVWCYHAGGASKRYFPKKHDIILLYGKNAARAKHNVLRIPYRDWDAHRAGPKSHLYHPEGKMLHDWWEISQESSLSKERTRYPTQKPLALLRQVILASSDESDLVLDPFGGCGTTVVAANKLNRKWIGIDISTYPVGLILARLHDIRKQIHVEGIPQEMAGARLLAKKPFEFEKWAVMLIPGMNPSERQTGDGGIDGDGWLEHDIPGAVKPPAAKTPFVVAQVTVSPGANLDKIKALDSSMRANNALFGVYITLEKIAPTPSVRKIIAAAGKVKDGAREYPRLQLWSAEDFFANRPADLPALATTRIMARGAAKAKISQGDLESDSF